MHKRSFSVLLTVALVGGLLTLGSPSQAKQDAPPFGSSNFNPQDALIGADGITTLVLSDQFDGVDTLAHLTSVSTANAVSATYVVCPPGGFAGPATTVPPAGCQVIGTDSEGTTPLGFQSDKAFEVFWDIPATFNEITRDVGVYHCTGAPGSSEPGGNCDLEVETGVFIDDGQTGTDSSSAELIDYCVSADGDADCDDPGDTSAKPITHGTGVPNLSAYPAGAVLVVTARGSDDIGTLTLCVDTPADAQTEPNSCAFSDSSGAAAAAAFNDYTFTLNVAQSPDNSEMAWFLHDLTGGIGACAGAASCLLDNHYVVSSEPEATEAALTFDVPDADCDNPVTEEANELGDDVDVILCLTDQFGDPFVGPATIESTFDGADTSGFEVCDGGAGVLHDHDGDGYFEHCHGDTDANGELDATIGNPSDNAVGGPAHKGTQTLTGCSDVQNDPNDPPTDPPVANHGCADETVKATATKTWFSLPSVVTLAFAPEGGVTDPVDTCLNGEAFMENKVGDTEDLLVCTFDDFGNLTDTAQANGGRLQWTIEPSGGGDKTGVEFTSPPPSDTVPDGTAPAQIIATRRSGNFICVELENVGGSGASVDTDCVEKVVTPGGGGARADSKVTIKDKFKGRVKSPAAACKNGRKVFLKKAKPGKDKTIGTDTAGQAGRWRISRPNVHGRFYAKVKRNAQCKGARSRTVTK